MKLFKMAAAVHSHGKELAQNHAQVPVSKFAVVRHA